MGNALKVGECVGQPCHQMLRTFLQEAFKIEQSAVAEHHAQEAHPSPGAPDFQAPVRPPIHLRRLSGSKAQRLVDAVLLGPDLAQIVAQDASASVITHLFELLINLHHGEVGLFEPMLDGAFKRLQLARAWRACPALVAVFPKPLAHGLLVDPDFQGDLRAGMPFQCLLPDPAVGGVVDHCSPPSGIRKKSPTLSVRPVRCRESPLCGSSVRSWQSGRS